MEKILWWLIVGTCLAAILLVFSTTKEQFMNGQMIIKGGKGPLVIDMGYDADVITGSPARAKQTI